jgi:hypothetical protein
MSWPARKEAPDSLFGNYIVVVPDCNYDGLPEVLIRAEYEEVTNARVYLFLSCSADWNFSDTVDSADVFDFLGDFFADRADFNHDGATTSQDFFDFLNAFFAGCPAR